MKTLVKKEEEIKSNNEIIKKIMLDGDLSGLDDKSKVKYYNMYCNRLGLDPTTQPFGLITFRDKYGNEKVQLYAKKECSWQLAKRDGISVIEKKEKVINDVLMIEVTVQNKDGRNDIDVGAVNIKNLSGDALANAYMKCTTKAKRRAILSISGIGLIDESEIHTVKGATTETIKDVTPKKKSQELKIENDNQTEEKIEKSFEDSNDISLLYDKLKPVIEKGKVKIDNDVLDITFLDTDKKMFELFQRMYIAHGIQMSEKDKKRFFGIFEHYITRDEEMIKTKILEVARICYGSNYFDDNEKAKKYYVGIKSGKYLNSLIELINERNLLFKLINERSK